MYNVVLSQGDEVVTAQGVELYSVLVDNCLKYIQGVDDETTKLGTTTQGACR